MTQEEVDKAFNELKSEGMEDEDLIVALGKMYQEGEITKDQLGALIDRLGYEFTDDFAKMSDEDSKNNLFAKPEEDKAEGDEKPEPEEPTSEEDKPEDEGKPEDKPEEDEGESEEEERRKAMSLFGR